VVPPGRSRLSHARRIGIADLELCLAAGNPEAVLGDGHRRPLPDDVAAQVNPRCARELEPKARRLGERAMHRGRDVQRFEDDQSTTDSPGVRGQPPERPLLGGRKPAGQIDHQQVDRTAGQESAREGKAFRVVGRPDDDEPAQVDTATHRFVGIERTGKVEVSNDRSGRLRLRHPAQRERCLAAREVTADRRTCLAWQAARPKCRIESGKSR
jgi:hypothetical protein